MGELAEASIDDPCRAAEAYANRGWVYAAIGKEDEAVADMETAFQCLADGTEMKVPVGTVHRLAELSLLMGHRSEAASWSAQLRQAAPENAVAAYNIALVACCLAQPEEYRAACRAMLDRFLDDTSTITAHWLAWTCSLGPDAVTDFSPAVAAAERTVEGEPESVQYLGTLGAILYRAGRLEEAVERLIEADKRIEVPDAALSSSPAYTWYFLAMAHYELGTHAEAQKWLDTANDWSEKVLREHDEGTATLPWNRRMTLELLREETEGLIGAEDVKFKSGADEEEGTPTDTNEEANDA
jgi:tetratricopeptide (TPR) repeat protein